MAKRNPQLNFEIGDIVERINHEHAGMKVGVQGIIIGVVDQNFMIEGFRGPSNLFSHDRQNLKLIKRGTKSEERLAFSLSQQIRKEVRGE